MRKKITLWGLLVVFILSGIFFLSRINFESGDVDVVERGTSGVIGDHVKGDPTDAVVTIVEYSDFECPACKSYKALLDDAMKSYANQKVVLVYRHFPLDGIHPHARLAAKASEAAGLQGKFWEMSDILFAEQEKWSKEQDPTAVFVSYAEKIGLNVDMFKSDITSQKVIDKVNKDASGARKLGLNGTPTIFINKTKLESLPGTSSDFKKIIDDELLALGEKPDTGILESNNETGADTLASTTIQKKSAN